MFTLPRPVIGGEARRAEDAEASLKPVNLESHAPVDTAAKAGERAGNYSLPPHMAEQMDRDIPSDAATGASIASGKEGEAV